MNNVTSIVRSDLIRARLTTSSAIALRDLTAASERFDRDLESGGEEEHV
jgi:hypothetical protein